MAKLMVDKITISGASPVDLTLVVKGSVEVDKDTVHELAKGVEYISGEKVVVNVDTVDESMAIYNALRTALINKDVNITFFKGATTLFAALGVRCYPKPVWETADVPKVNITGGKKFGSSETITNHITMPS